MKESKLAQIIREETYTYTGTKNKFGWGIALSPQVGIKLNKVTPYSGLDFQLD